MLIKKPKQIRMLASPSRLAIFDVLEAAGPCSASEIAQALGRPPDSVYYHLNVLMRCGLVVDREPTRGKKGGIFDVAGRPTRLHYDPRLQANKAAILAVISSMVRDAVRAFGRNFVVGEVVNGAGRTLWAGRRTAWLTATELRRLNNGILNLTRRLEFTRGRSRRAKLYAFSFVVSPYGRRQKLVIPSTASRAGHND
jgi:DNA-binding transcriptional ArsR family regulator